MQNQSELLNFYIYCNLFQHILLSPFVRESGWIIIRPKIDKLFINLKRTAPLQARPQVKEQHNLAHVLLYKGLT